MNWEPDYVLRRCPVPNVFKSGEGSALMADQPRAAAIIRGCKKSGKIITVKCRTGIQRENMYAAEFARMFEDAGADMISIHGRSRSMMFYRCRALREVSLLPGIDEVGNLAFAQSGVKKAFVGGDGRGYGTGVFFGALRLRSVILEEGIRQIPDRFAYGCTSLEEVILPETLESVGKHVWEKTPFLEKWREEGCGGRIFWDGRDLEGEVNLPEQVRVVAGCISLVPGEMNLLKQAGENAFEESVLDKAILGENGLKEGNSFLSVAGSIVVSGESCSGEIRITSAAGRLQMGWG